MKMMGRAGRLEADSHCVSTRTNVACFALESVAGQASRTRHALVDTLHQPRGAFGLELRHAMKFAAAYVGRE
jgi:hypothetical protein